MSSQVLEDMKGLIDYGLRKYLKKNRKTGAHRFWNLLRSDLMRRSPDMITDYLRTNSKLTEAGTFGDDLARKYFDGKIEEEQRANQKELIRACLEMDAAWRLSQFDIDNSLKESLRGKLKIWEVPL